MSSHRPIPSFDQSLPILERREEIAAAIRDHQVVIVTGETGSGKTTQLPQICLALGRGAAGAKIAHTQPRRLAARAVAARIAEELRVPLGGAVGVKVRFTDRTSERTIIKLMTDGILLAEIQGDPELRAYDTVIIDEAHERSLNIDFVLGYLRQLLTRRADLRVIVTSATIEPGRFAKFFARDGKDAPIINVSGRMYPVEVRYRPIESRDGGSRLDARAVAEAVEDVLSIRADRGAGGTGPAGDVLVFLPGEGEIRQVGDELRRMSANADVLSLYSRLSNDEQDRIFHPGDRRRVVLATNVAETSLTVPRIRFVVDAGLARISRYDARAKVERLPVEAISQASAKQRSGRCGRVASGVAVRLYSEASFRERAVFTDPEIRRTNLASVILHLMLLDLGTIEDFAFLDPPETHAIRDGYETLFELGAIERWGENNAEADNSLKVASSREEEKNKPTPNPSLREGLQDRPTHQPLCSGSWRLTSIGRAMARLPVDPRVARMLLAAGEQGALAEVLVLAAALSIQDPRERPGSAAEAADRAQIVFRHEASDFLSLLKIWDQFHHAAGERGSSGAREWCRAHFLSYVRMREWMDTHEQLAEIAEELDLAKNETPASEDRVHRALLTGLISNVACKDEGQSYDYRGVRGNVVSIFPGSVLFKKNPKWIMAAEIVQTTKLYARTIAKIDPAWIEELAGHMFQRQLSDKHYDAETHEPSAWERVTMNGIVVVPRRRVALAALDRKAARTVFVREGLATGRFGEEYAFVRHNRGVLAAARSAEAKLRRRGLVRGEEEIAAWFEARLGAEVCDPASFRGWIARSGEREGAGEESVLRRLRLALVDVLKPEAAAAADADAFPEALTFEAYGEAMTCPMEYAFEPGKEHDGVTLRLPLLALHAISEERAEWLVPGMLEAKVQALLKALPKGVRAALEAKGGLAELAHEAAAVLVFGSGSLGAALSEAVEVLRGVAVANEAWMMSAVPAHVRLRFEVVDQEGKELASGREMGELRSRLEVRHKRAAANLARARFERQGIAAWTFGELPESVEIEVGEQVTRGFPALVDERACVSMTLLGSAEAAAAETARGVRRLFALACGEELRHRLHALGNWSDLCKWYKAIGAAEELEDALACLIVERAFLASQAPVRTREAFEARQQEQWGRLPQATMEVAEAAGKMLEPRFRVAHRISGGTPRLWASSIADLREHAAYLMPAGFLRLAAWERLREYPRYAQGMWERLLRLREDGSGTETAALGAISPHWKRYTGWVARQMAAARAEQQEAGEATAARKGNVKAPLPQARRVAPRVNVDAGEWAMQAGAMTAELVAYRWALEEYRLALFVPELARGAKAGAMAKQLEEMWKGVEGGGRG